jgi:hypothetical protein
MLDHRSFPANFHRQYGGQLKMLKVCDFVNRDNVLLPMARVAESTNIHFSVFTFQTIVGLIRTAKTKYSKNSANEKTSCDIRTFINRSKKGSSRFRKILSFERLDYIPHNIVKYSSTTETIIGLECSKKLNLAWRYNHLSNSTRTFLFKLHNNTLGYNHAVSHFVRNHSPNCTFCDIAGNQEVERETPLHLFFMCELIEDFLNDFFVWFTNDQNFSFTRQEFFVGFNREEFNNEKNEILTLASHIVKKFIWDSKQRFCIPNNQHMRLHFELEFESIAKINRKFHGKLRDNGFLWIINQV